MYELQAVQFARVFERLPDSVAAALGIMKPEPSTRAVVQLNGPGLAATGELAPSRKSVSLPLKEKDVDFVASPFRCRDSCHNYISIRRARGAIPMTLSQPRKRQRLLTKPVIVPLHTVLEKEEDLV